MMMFDYPLAHWLTFFSATLLLTLSPGPDMAYIIAQSTKNGRRAGFYAMFGAWSGAFIHVILSVIGLSALIAASSTTFTIAKWVGAGYLVWLGIQALRSDGGSLTSKTPARQANGLDILRRGILVSLLNPKAGIFFLAFLPQFVVTEAGPESAQLLLHGTLVIVVAACIEVPLVFIGARLSQSLNSNPHISRWLDRSLGALFIGLGLKLAFSQRG